MPFTLALPSERAEDTRRWLERLTSDDHVLVAELDGRVVGIVGLHVRSGKQRHSASVGMVVADDFQGRGIGRRLLSAALDLADDHLGLLRVDLEVLHDNRRAIALYERSGFELGGPTQEGPWVLGRPRGRPVLRAARRRHVV